MDQTHYKRHEQIANQVMEHLGSRLNSFCWLAMGSSSVVYRLQSSNSDFVLRVASPNPGKSAKYESDFAIRDDLKKVTPFVAVPVITNRDVELGGNIGEWAVDVYCDGFSPNRGDVPANISSQIGTLLKALHNLPAKRYGPLENNRTEFTGIEKDRCSGFLRRFERPWPFNCPSLQTHPAIVQQPALLKPLENLETDLHEFGVSGAQAIVHGDLHEKQILIKGNNLSALLDFNESFVGRPEWDLGSYLYFHGTECFEHLMNGYCQKAVERSALFKTANLAAILIALHHGNRSTILNRPKRLVASTSFLEEQLLLN